MGQKQDSSTLLNIFLGSNQFFCSRQSCVLVSFQGDDGANDLLVATRRNGLLLLSGKVFDKDGNLVVELVENKPKGNINAIYGEPNRPDKSTLQVLDNKDNVALYIHYINGSNLLLEGAFFQPQPVDRHIANSMGLIVGPDTMRIAGRGPTFTHTCMGGAGRSDVLLGGTP